MRDKLFTTRELLHSCLAHPEENLLETLRRGGGYVDSTQLLDELKLLHRSLQGTKDNGIADGVVLNAIRRVQTFGCSLMRLDIRQESTRHRDVINALTTYLELGSFTEWPEEAKIEWLIKELQVRPPLHMLCALGTVSPSAASRTCSRSTTPSITQPRTTLAARRCPWSSCEDTFEGLTARLAGQCSGNALLPACIPAL